MFTKITIPVDELARLARDMKQDKMSFVTLKIEEPDNDGDPLPACVTFHACTDLHSPEIVDYGEIEATEDPR